MKTQERDWSGCYAALHAKLAGLGVESPYGEGDYWLVDDDYGGLDQKICIFNPRFLSRSLLEEIQSVLKANFENWRVFIVLEVPKLLATQQEVGGLIVKADSVEEHWKRPLVESALGEALAY